MGPTLLLHCRRARGMYLHLCAFGFILSAQTALLRCEERFTHEDQLVVTLTVVGTHAANPAQP